MLSHFLRAIQKQATSVIGFVGYTDGENSSTGSVTISVPSGTQSGDLLVAFAYASTAGTLWSATGSNWTITNSTNSTAPRLTAFYRIADGTTSFTFSQNSASADIGVTLMAFSDANIDVISTLASAADPIVIPSVTATNNKSLQLITAGGNVNEPASTPAGFTEITLNTGAAQPDWGVYYKPNISSGSTGTVSVDMVGSANTSGMQVVLKEKSTFSFVTSTVSATSSQNFTFSSISLGSAVANRVIIVAVISSGGGQSVSSVTVGGNSTTLTASTSGATCMAFAALSNSTLTSGDIVVNHSGTRTDGCSIAVFNGVLTSNLSPTSSLFPTGSAGTTNLSTGNLTVGLYNYAIGLLAKANSNSVTWGNATQIATHTGLNSRNFYFATADIVVPSSTYAITASWTGSTSSRIGGGIFT